MGSFIRFFTLSLLFILINSQQIYVNPSSGNDTENCGTIESPCQTIQHAIYLAGNNTVIVLESATYQISVPLETNDKNNLTFSTNGKVDINAQNGFLNSSNSFVNIYNVSVYTNQFYLIALNNSRIYTTQVTLNGTGFSQDAIFADSSNIFFDNINFNANLVLEGSLIRAINTTVGIIGLYTSVIKQTKSVPLIEVKDGAFILTKLFSGDITLSNSPLLRLENTHSINFFNANYNYISNASSLFDFRNISINFSQFSALDVSCSVSLFNLNQVFDVIKLDSFKVQSVDAPLFQPNVSQTNNNLHAYLFNTKFGGPNFSPDLPFISLDSSSTFNLTIQLSTFDYFKQGVFFVTPSSNTKATQSDKKSQTSYINSYSSNFNNNSAQKGAVLYIVSSNEQNIQFLSTNSFYNSNTATQDGGVAYIIDSSFNVNFTAQYDNYDLNVASRNGGAFYFENLLNATLLKGQIANSSSSNGAAVYSSGSSLTSYQTCFTNNSASNNGGAAYLFNTNAVVTTIASNNRAINFGGNFFVSGNSSSLTLTDSPVTESSALNGAVVYCASGSSVILDSVTSYSLSSNRGSFLFAVKNFFFF